MKIKALLFDFDETLLVNEDSTRESARYAWKWVMNDYPDIPIGKVVESYMDSRDKFWHVPDDEVIPRIQQGMNYARTYLWRKTLESLNVKRDDIIKSLVQRFGEKRFDTWRLYPDSREILDTLKPNYKLIMATNGIPEVQWGKVRKVDVESYFHLILISGELGISKPDPRFLYKAAKAVNVQINECIMIGDSVRNDVGGAKNAEMLSVWVNRENALPRPSIQPDYEIHQLKELLPILEKLG